MVTWWQSLLISMAPAAIAAFAAWYVAYCQIRNTKKELQVKYENENRLHISKMRFDTEFSIYKELCEKFVTMVFDVMNLFPDGIYFEPPDEQSKQEYHLQLYKKCESIFNEANLAVNKYACFIAKTIFDEFVAIKQKCVIQINWFFQYQVRHSSDDKVTECFLRTSEIRQDFDTMIEKLRQHISSLSNPTSASKEEKNKNAD